MGTSKLSGKPDEMLGGGGGGYLQWANIPSRVISNIPSHFMLQTPVSYVGKLHLVCEQT